MFRWLRPLICAALMLCHEGEAPDQEASALPPLKVYVLLGQSNMVGFGRIEPHQQLGTLSNLVNEQERFPELINKEGKWAARDDVWLVQVTVQQRQGWLEPVGRHFGPELGFGQVIGDLHEEPVLLIKASQGNRSLGWDILPPGSERFEHDGRIYAGYGDDTPSWVDGEEKKPVNWYAGKQYDDFLRDTKEVFADIKKFYPDYDGRPVEIAGFVWWQGHKDQNPAHASRYEQNLVHLIHSLRKDLKAPLAKFVLATIAFDGWELKGPGARVAEAQLAVSGERGKYKAFANNVRTVEVRNLWKPRDKSPTGQGHHYNHNAETYYQVGRRLGKAMAHLMRPKSVSSNSSTPSDAPTDRPPNVLLIISDDQHGSDFGFLGNKTIQTPNLDRLAQMGLVFPRGYVTAPLCRPSLATLATGLHPHQHGITGNDPPRGQPREAMLKRIDACTTLPDLLVAHGYRAMQTGKWWEGAHSRGGFTEGMTHGDPARGGRHGDEGLRIGREGLLAATDFIDDCEAEDTPWMLWYAPFLPHSPHNPPDSFLAAAQAPGVPLPIAKYRAMCAWFDATCGDLLGHLDQSGARERTLVVFVTDNGWIQQEDGRGFAPRSKRTAYEGGVRTPIMLSLPGKITPARCETAVSSVDLPPTILELCGIEVPDSWPGKNLLDVAASGPSARGPVFGAAYTHDVADLNHPTRGLVTRYVVVGQYKLLIHTDPQLPPELYNLAKDPIELHPIADPQRIAKLRGLLDAWWSPQLTSPPGGK
jgi:arylsulfatase A-like enzyme